jgi:signal transduction histidine kinase
MKPQYRVFGILLFLGIFVALSAQPGDGSAFLSGKVIFDPDSIYPLKPYSVILQKDWPITYSQFEQQPIDSNDYSFHIQMDLDQLTYGSIIINFYRDIDSTALARQGHWTGSEKPDSMYSSDGFIRKYISRIRFSGMRFVIEPGDSVHMVVNYNDADSVGRPSVYFSGTGANNNNLRRSMYTVGFDSESFRLPLDEGLGREDDLLVAKLEELQAAKDSISEAYYELLHADALFDNLGSKHALIRASLYGSDRSIDEKRALARHYYTFLDTLTLKPEYLSSREFRGFLNFYLEYINRIVTGRDVWYEASHNNLYLAKSIFEPEILKTFLFERLSMQMNEINFYKTRGFQYYEFEKLFPNTPESYRLKQIHLKRFPVSNGQPAPDLELIDSLGKTSSLSDLKGKVVLLSTYYTSYRMDESEQKRMKELREKFRGTEIVMVNLGSRSGDPGEFFHPSVDYYVKEWPANINLPSYQFRFQSSYTFIIRKNGIIEDRVRNLEISDEIIDELKSEKYTFTSRLNIFIQDNTRAVILTFSLLLLLTVIFFLRARLKHKQQIMIRKQLNSELKAIRSQLNPHFLFNSLNSLQNFINKSDTKTANQHLSRFSQLMRSIIELSEKESISLQEELDFNRTFIELEQYRYGFKCTFDIDSGMDLNNVEIPSMIIQPFVENAIVHAMAEMGKKGEMGILVRESEDNKVGIEIRDNGKGMRNVSEDGFGLKSSRERIDLINAQSREKIELFIHSPPDSLTEKGTLVKLIIPKKY